MRFAGKSPHMVLTNISREQGTLLYFRSPGLSIGMLTSLYPNNWGINLPSTVPGRLKLPSISSTKVTLLGLPSGARQTQDY